MGWKATVSITVGETDLTLEEVFPDGLVNTQPTANTVLDALRGTSSNKLQVLDSWMLLEDLTVDITVTDEAGTKTQATWS